MTLLGMAKGPAALLLLGSLTPVSIAVGALVERRCFASRLRAQLAALTCGLAPMALGFWFWALQSCQEDGFNAGVINYALVLIAGGLRWGALVSEETPGGLGLLEHSRCVARGTRWALPLACGLVCFHYLTSLLLLSAPSAPWTLTLYFFVGGFWWLCAAVAVAHLNGAVAADLEGLDSRHNQGEVQEAGRRVDKDAADAVEVRSYGKEAEENDQDRAHHGGEGAS